jgi:CubicO group peptidase (beta-lactamase class C family)
MFVRPPFQLRARAVTALALVAILAFACGPQVVPAAPPSQHAATPGELVYPGAHWERAIPESVGFSAVGLERARQYARTLATTGLVVVVRGWVVLDDGDTTELSYLASARKSVLAMLMGTYVARGDIRLDANLASLDVNDLGGLSDAERAATVEDLLEARSGVYHPAANPGDDSAAAPPRGSQPHGSYFLYNNWDFNALGAIFEARTGRNIYDALASNLATPLEMEDFRRDAQRKSGDLTRSIYPAYHIYLSTRDMARLGYLMLRRGRWRDTTVIPEEWVARMTSAHTPLEQMNPAKLRVGRFGYGYLWWVFDDAASRSGGPLAGAYSAIGAYGQYITVIPKLELVIAHKTARHANRGVSRDEYLRLMDLIVAAART